MFTLITILYLIGAVLFYNYLAHDKTTKDDPLLNIFMAIFWLPGLVFIAAFVGFALVLIALRWLVILPFKILHYCLVDLAKLGKELGKR